MSVNCKCDIEFNWKTDKLPRLKQNVFFVDFINCIYNVKQSLEDTQYVYTDTNNS